MTASHVIMWEVRTADGQLAQLQEWVLARVDPAAQVYVSAGDEPRLVVIDPTGEVTAQLAELPAGLATRPAHAWPFEAVRNV